MNENSLAEALKDRTIAGAALDVVSTEPIAPNNPLLSAPNCLLTPHMAWASLESRKRLMNATATNIEAFGANNPVNVVN